MNTQQATKEQKLEFLESGIKINKRIKQLANRLETYKEDVYTLKASHISDLPRGGQHSDLGDKVVRVLDMETKINNELDRMLDKKQMIEETIDMMEDSDEKSVLEMRYVDGTLSKEVAVFMGRTTTNIFWLRNRGVNALPLTVEDYNRFKEM